MVDATAKSPKNAAKATATLQNRGGKVLLTLASGWPPLTVKNKNFMFNGIEKLCSFSKPYLCLTAPEKTEMKTRKTGFTLVEILIVVIILGILAAIVIPQFTEASNDARESSLVSNLQTLRSQCELYKVQHLDEYPDVGAADGTVFVTRMNTKTDDTHLAGGNLGPYLQQFPSNPFNGLNTVRLDGAAAGANTEGWRFDTALGQIVADDGGTSPDGTLHADL